MLATEFSKFILSTIFCASQVIHIGAHIGFFDVLIGKLLRSNKGVLWTFEASPEMHKILAHNILINHLDNVTTFNFAISSYDGDATLVYNLANTGGASIAHYENRHQKEFTVPARKLDTCLKDVSGIDLLFMDIEGSEYEAIKGMKNILKKSSNCVIIMEFSKRMFLLMDSSVDEFFQFITDGDYNLFLIEDSLRPLTSESLYKIEQDPVDIILIPQKGESKFIEQLYRYFNYFG